MNEYVGFKESIYVFQRKRSQLIILILNSRVFSYYCICNGSKTNYKNQFGFDLDDLHKDVYVSYIEPTRL